MSSEGLGLRAWGSGLGAQGLGIYMLSLHPVSISSLPPPFLSHIYQDTTCPSRSIKDLEPGALHEGKESFHFNEQDYCHLSNRFIIPRSSSHYVQTFFMAQTQSSRSARLGCKTMMIALTWQD